MAANEQRGPLLLPSASPEEVTNVQSLYVPPYHRLNLQPGTRIRIAGLASFLAGTGLGATHGAKMAGLRFRAEHAHKLPTETTGWYLYHKSKNHAAAVGGFKEGFSMGLKTSFWATSMLAIESLFDTSRGTADILNTMTAGLTVAGAFSLWNGFTIPEAGRTAWMALLVSAAWGGLQDMAGVARGRRIGYVEFVRQRMATLGRTNSDKNPPA